MAQTETISPILTLLHPERSQTWPDSTLCARLQVSDASGIACSHWTSGCESVAPEQRATDTDPWVLSSLNAGCAFAEIVTLPNSANQSTSRHICRFGASDGRQKTSLLLKDIMTPQVTGGCRPRGPLRLQVPWSSAVGAASHRPRFLLFLPSTEQCEEGGCFRAHLGSPGYGNRRRRAGPLPSPLGGRSVSGEASRKWLYGAHQRSVSK